MPIDCELCGVSFRDQVEMKEHMARLHREARVAFEDSLFECGDCQRSYPARSDLNRHVERNHTA